DCLRDVRVGGRLLLYWCAWHVLSSFQDDRKCAASGPARRACRVWYDFHTRRSVYLLRHTDLQPADLQSFRSTRLWGTLVRCPIFWSHRVRGRVPFDRVPICGSRWYAAPPSNSSVAVRGFGEQEQTQA